MKIELKKIKNISSAKALVYLVKRGDIKNLPLTDQENSFLNERLNNDEKIISINRFPQWLYIVVAQDKESCSLYYESLRKAAFNLHAQIKTNKHSKVVVVDGLTDGAATLAFVEGMALSNYQFTKYFTTKDGKESLIDTIALKSDNVTSENLEELEAVITGVCHARDLVNEPVSFLNAMQWGQEVKKMGTQAGFDVEVMGRSKIESLKMGGLLAVNKGSVDPPTFTVMEWKPENAVNEKPVVLVGKGIVYDTGGLSLKPTKNSMDYMKSDMGGAAAVAGAIYAVAKARIDVHVIGLVPATDNRPNGNAYAPGDIITMHNGLNVEVLNTDAEGRLVLADALSYASRYCPGFVVDVATLTGAAAVAIGKYGVVAMANKKGRYFLNKVSNAGDRVYERVVEFPLWSEYDELLKSDIADLKNLGSGDGGAITAGKFLEHFTDYPWAHIDIAGPAFVDSTDSYRGKGGTGVGVRLLFEFIKQYKD